MCEERPKRQPPAEESANQHASLAHCPGWLALEEGAQPRQGPFLRGRKVEFFLAPRHESGGTVLAATEDCEGVASLQPRPARLRNCSADGGGVAVPTRVWQMLAAGGSELAEAPAGVCHTEPLACRRRRRGRRRQERRARERARENPRRGPRTGRDGAPILQMTGTADLAGGRDPVAGPPDINSPRDDAGVAAECAARPAHLQRIGPAVGRDGRARAAGEEPAAQGCRQQWRARARRLPNGPRHPRPHAAGGRPAKSPRDKQAAGEMVKRGLTADH